MAKKKPKHDKGRTDRERKKSNVRRSKPIQRKKVNKVSKRNVSKAVQRQTKDVKRKHKEVQKKTTKSKKSIERKPVKPIPPSQESNIQKAKRLIKKGRATVKKQIAEAPATPTPKGVSKKSYPLLLEGAKLNKKEIDFVKRVAEIKKVDVSTPYKLRSYFNKYKDVFKIEFASGITSLKKTIPNIIKDIEKASEYDKKFIVRTDGKNPKEVSKEKFIWHMVTMENYINNALGTSFMQLPYTLSFQNEFEVNLPSYKAIRSYETDYDLIDALDSILEEYDIIVYTDK